MAGAAEPTKLFNPGAHDIVNRSVTLAQLTNDPRYVLKVYTRSLEMYAHFRIRGM